MIYLTDKNVLLGMKRECPPGSLKVTPEEL